MGCQPTKQAAPEQRQARPLDLEALRMTPGMFIGQNKRKITDNYVIQEKMGTGAFGTVKKVICRKTGLERACKSIRKTKNAELDINLLAEVALLKQLDHPNIMKLLEFYEADNSYHLVTELYTGGELFDKITTLKKFTQRDAAVVMRQVLSGITYCHALKVVHRDLKPENLLLESKAEDANIKIIDFGTASAFTKGKHLNEVIGTPYYLAPEVVTKRYDEKVDVWSCGVILYILLCGSPPFNGENSLAIIDSAKKGHVRMNGREWAAIDQGAKQLILKMLTLDPVKRISAAQALADPWIVKFSKSGMQAADPKAMGALASLSNLRSFARARQLETATLTFIASQLTSREEKEQLTSAFQELDLNGDGRLSRMELIRGWSRVFPDSNISEREINELFDRADTDGSGEIDYTEFLVATMNRDALLSKKNLRAAFDRFDADGSGKISKPEMAQLFGLQNISQEAWASIVTGVDGDGDGEVDFEEFCQMMHRVSNS